MNRKQAHDLWISLNWEKRYEVMTLVQGSRNPKIMLNRCLDFLIEIHA